jgi:hypothetical protein
MIADFVPFVPRKIISLMLLSSTPGYPNATHETHELAASAKLAAPPNPLSPAKLAAPLDPSPAKVIAPPTPSPAKKVANGGLTKRKRSLDRRAAEDMEQTLQTYLFETTITPMGK